MRAGNHIGWELGRSIGRGRSGSELLNEIREALHLAIVGTVHAQRHAAGAMVGRQQVKPKVTSVCVHGSHRLCQVRPGRASAVGHVTLAHDRKAERLVEAQHAARPMPCRSRETTLLRRGRACPNRPHGGHVIESSRRPSEFGSPHFRPRSRRRRPLTAASSSRIQTAPGM